MAGSSGRRCAGGGAGPCSRRASVSDPGVSLPHGFGQGVAEVLGGAAHAVGDGAHGALRRRMPALSNWALASSQRLRIWSRRGWSWSFGVHLGQVGLDLELVDAGLPVVELGLGDAAPEVVELPTPGRAPGLRGRRHRWGRGHSCVVLLSWPAGLPGAAPTVSGESGRRPAGHGHGAARSTRTASRPPPGVWRSSARPPSAVTSFWTMARPSPLPPSSPRVEVARQKPVEGVLALLVGVEAGPVVGDVDLDGPVGRARRHRTAGSSSPTGRPPGRWPAGCRGPGRGGRGWRRPRRPSASTTRATSRSSATGPQALRRSSSTAPSAMAAGGAAPAPARCGPGRAGRRPGGTGGWTSCWAASRSSDGLVVALVLEHLEAEPEGGERRAQLVRRVGDELLLGGHQLVQPARRAC